jgi:hypothetical protein
MLPQLKIESPDLGLGVASHPNSGSDAKETNSSSLEVQLLLAVSRLRLDPAQKEHLRRLAAGNVDWEFVFHHAEEQRITSLLYKNLSEVCPELVPQRELTQLKQHASENARLNLYRTGELIKVLSLLAANGIPALPFKGPALSMRVYGNLGLRTYGDLDILVAHHDVLRTKDLLLKRGYHLVSRSNGHKEPDISTRMKDLIFDSSDGEVRVELHWRLTGSHFDFPLDLDSLWRRLEPVSIGSYTIRTLAPQDLLLYLCMHGSRHGWERLLWVCDVVELIRSCPMDWESVTNQARTLGCRRTLALGLVLARDLLDLELPPEVWRQINVEPSVEILVAQLRESLFHAAGADRGISYWNEIHLRMRERLSDRLRLRVHYYRRYLRLAVIPNELDHAMVELPQELSFLYYVLRSFRLVKRFGVNRFNRLRGVSSGSRS